MEHVQISAEEFNKMRQSIHHLTAYTAKQGSEIQTLKELAAALMAELAYTKENPYSALDKMIEDEEGAVFNSIREDTIDNPTYKQMYAKKAEARNFIFRLARSALKRMMTTR